MTGHSKTLVLLIVAGAGMLVTAVPARAQFAVIDAASVTQLIGQARTLAQELVTARAQLASAEQLYTSMSGSRGMQRLLGGMSRAGLLKITQDDFEKEGRTIHFQRAVLTPEGYRGDPAALARVEMAEEMPRTRKKRQRRERPADAGYPASRLRRAASPARIATSATAAARNSQCVRKKPRIPKRIAKTNITAR